MTAPTFYEAAIAAFRAGDNARTRELSEQALASARAAGSTADEVEALSMLARVALRDEDFQLVEAVAGEARDVARASGDQRLERVPLHMQAAAARLGGDPDRAAALYEESLALNRRLGEARMAVVEQRNLAYVRWHAGDDASARELFAQARDGGMTIRNEGDLPYLVADAAVIALMDGEYERAAGLLGAAQQAFNAAGQIPDPDDEAELQALRRQLAAALGEEPFRKALEAPGIRADWNLLEN